MKQLSSITSAKNNKQVFLTASLYILMFAYAISTTIIGPLIPFYIQEYGISLSQGGIIVALQGLGGLLAIIAGMFFVEKITKALMVKLTFIIYCFAVISITLFQTYSALLVLFFLIGASTKMLDGGLNAYVADLNPKKRQRNVNLLHAFFGFGALAGPIFSSTFLHLELKVDKIFLSLGLFCILCFLIYYFVQTKKTTEVKQADPITKNNIISFFKSRDIIILASLCLIYTGIASGISTWMPTLLTVDHHSSLYMSSLPVSFLWVGIIIARVTYSAISERANLKKLIGYSNLVCAVFWIIALFINSPIVVIIACGISGLCMGAIIPVSVAIACNMHPKNTGTVSLIIFLFVAVGHMLIPWLIGIIGDAISLWFSMLSMGILLIMISILSFFSSSKADAISKKQFSV